MDNLLPTDEEITRIDYVFISITGNELVTSNGNFTVVNAPNLVNLFPDEGQTACQLNGEDQYVDLSNWDKDSCLWNPAECQFGITVSFGLKV